MGSDGEARSHSDRVIWWGLVFSVLLHGAALAWVGFKFPGLIRMVKIEPPPVLRVKLNRQASVVAPEEEATAPVPENPPEQPPENSAETYQEASDSVPPEPRGGWDFDMEKALSSETRVAETPDILSTTLPASRPETLDMTASHYAVGELDLSGHDRERTPSREGFADVLDPRVRQRLHASRQNRKVAQPDLFQEVNNRSLSGGSEMASFGDACFEITDAIGGRSNEKMWFRTQCKGTRTLSERMLNSVDKALKARAESPQRTESPQRAESPQRTESP